MTALHAIRTTLSTSMLAAALTLAWPGPGSASTQAESPNGVSRADTQRTPHVSRQDWRRGPKVRPLQRHLLQRPVGTNTATVSQREIQQTQAQKQRLLQRVVSYLDNNPEEIERYIDPSSYVDFRRAVSQGQIHHWIGSQPERTIRVGEDTFVLQPVHVDLIDLGYALEAARDVAHLQRLYERIYDIVSGQLRGRLPHPNRLLRMRSEQARSHLEKIINIYKRMPLPSDAPLPDLEQTWNADCTTEIGAVGTDLTDGTRRCKGENFHDDSLFWNTQFPLKYQHTCIRSQGRRGTCVAFAITSLVESKLMSETGNAYNLSQQKTYFQGSKRRSFPGLYMYGLPMGKVMQEFVDNSVRFQFESVWNYNRSPGQSVLNRDDIPYTYPNSCWGYSGPMCTDLAFQAEEELKCADGQPKWTCERVYEYPAGNSDVDAEIDAVTAIKLPRMSSADALDIAIGLTGVAAEALAVGFNVHNSFQTAGSDGLVNWEGPSEDPGGHAAVLLGFVSNEQLPAGVTEAGERGYFILKNSWGAHRGDCGYYYVDYEYMRHSLRSMFAIDL